MSERLREKPRRGWIARELAVAFGAVSVVAVAMCTLLLALISQVSGLVTGMQEEEDSIRQGLELATAVREQYIHMARALIEGDDRHLAHYAEWDRQVREDLRSLAPEVPAAERWRVAALQSDTTELGRYFAADAFPAALRGDREQLATTSRLLGALADRASAQADAIARAVASRMAHSHVLATRATRLGLVGGGLGALLIVALSVGFTLHLRRAVLRPLGVVTDAARRLGAGDFGTRVGAVGQGELLALSRALDHMAEELAERQQRLVHNERMAAIGQLAAGVAHELNNPIGIIRGYLKTMSADDDPETLGEELRILDEEAAQCQRIAEDLLAYARPLELRVEAVEVEELLAETLRRFKETPAARDAVLELGAEPAKLSVDAARLRQVVLNLVQNAVQASAPRARVTVTGRRDGDDYLIEVADEGPGVPAEDRGHVFEPFYTRRPGGTGLGLSVCLGIARAHGGTVTVEPRDGAGAVFRVRLPARLGERDAVAGGAP